MAFSDFDRAARMRGLAIQFRSFATETHQASYQEKMRIAAEELERQAALLDHRRDAGAAHARRPH